MASLERVPAAQYVRMSTEHQRYSIDNQEAVIAEFADAHGFEIVKTYEDSGKSGLTLRERKGLQAMLEDVIGGKADYRAILVYDVSRWGRFQDCDESAHYEFLCKKSGIPVVYCAEQFANDGSVSAEILKALKRVMAGEYSRELSDKVYAGKKRMVLRGYHVGGSAVLGLRRKVISSDPKRNRILQTKEYKALTTDRIILVPGPKKEIETVRLVFELSKQMGMKSVAKELNRRGVFNRGKPWTRSSVDKIVRNEKYLGTNVWGMSTQRLLKGRKPIPPEQWIRKPGSFKPIIDLAAFESARRARLKRRRESFSDEEYLAYMRRLYRKHGTLTKALIKTSKRYGHWWHTRRFGSITGIYKALGEPLPRRYARVDARKKSDALIRRIALQAVEENKGMLTQHRPKQRQYLILRLTSGESITIRPCFFFSSRSGLPRWKVLPIAHDPSSYALHCLMAPKRDKVERWFLSRQLGPHIHTLAPEVGLMKYAVELKSLSEIPSAVLKLKLGIPRDRHTIRGIPAILAFLGCGEHELQRLRKQGLPLDHDSFHIVGDPSELVSWRTKLRN